MTEKLVIQVGQPPWQPSPDAELREVFNAYDMPLEGTFTQNGQWYVFKCVSNEAEDVNLWAYASISPAHASRLRDASESLDAVLAEATHERVTTVALAGPEGIEASWSLERPDVPYVSSILDSDAIVHAAIAAWKQIGDLAPLRAAG